MKYLGFILLACTISISACKKDKTTPSSGSNGNGTGGGNKKCYPASEIIAGVKRIEYIYNNDNRIIRANTFDSLGHANGYTEYEYDSANRLISANTFDIRDNITKILTFNYKGNNLEVVLTGTKPNHEDDALDECAFSGGRIIADTFYDYVFGQKRVLQYNAYSYDSKGNSNKISLYGFNYYTMKYDYISTTNYEYDDKVNPWKNLPDPRDISTNNCTKSVTIEENGAVTRVITASYTYNSDNYPVKTTEVTGNQTSTYETTYNCK